VPTYERDGVRLHYDVVGSGPPVLCVHGATGTGEYEWFELAGRLADRYRFVIPDLRSHGRSEHRSHEVGIEYVNDDLLGLIDRENLGQPHVLAFSFGAEAAIELELSHPGTASSLLLISPGLADPSARIPTRRELEAGWPRALRGLHTEHHGPNHWLELAVELCEQSTQRPKADLDAIGAIACPILAIVGSDDDPRRVRAARKIEAAHRSCHVVVIDGARHAAHKDHSAEVAAAIGGFLDELAPSRHSPAP
jgi:pimeloyl-ACP methyl ester carboxylesterase